MEKDLVGPPFEGLAFCFEDPTIGRCFRTIGRTVTEADIVSESNAPAWRRWCS